MKKIFFSLSIGIVAFSILAFDLSHYKRLDTAQGNRLSLVKNGSFEERTRFPNDGGKFVKRARAFGRNGGGGLRIGCNTDTRKTLSYLEINPALQPGKVYWMEIWLRQTGSLHPIVCVEAYTKAASPKYVYGVYSFGKIRTEGEWSCYGGKFISRGESPDLYNYRVVLGALCKNNQTGGDVFFDNLEIYEDLPEWYFEQTWPTHRRVSATNGKVRFNNHAVGNLLPKDAVPLLLLELFHSSGKKLQERTLSPSGHVVELAFGKLPPEKLSLKVTLLDTKNKIIGGEKKLSLNAECWNTNPDASCIIKENGCTVVNGKETLLAGIFASFPKESLPEIRKELLELRALGINCIHDYQLNWRYRPEGETKAYLDMCRELGILVSFGLYRQTAHARETPQKDILLRKIVETYRNHPALLAWYMADEPAPALIGRMARKRTLINELDPNHPTWLISVFPKEAYRFFPACDVFGWDPYPFREKGSDMKRYAADAMSLEKSGAIYWTVPQAFNWADYQPDPNISKDISLYNQWIEPTENQMLANTMLQAAYGAKVFLFYAWQSMKKGPEKSRFEERKKRLAGIVRTLREMEPYILSGKPIEKITAMNRNGKCAVFLFRDEKDNVRVAVIGLDASKNEAEFTLPQKTPPLKSTYGMIRPKENGKYLFSGESISCDILR